MRIQNSNLQKQTFFKGLLHQDKTGFVNDSSFFRDYQTLKQATEYIKEQFPQGAEILDYACSNGEETISLKCLLDDFDYKIIGYDCSTDALKLARKGVYTVFSHWDDSYLIKEDIYDNLIANSELPSKKEQSILREKFNRVMREISYNPRYSDINNKSCFASFKDNNKLFQEKFFEVRNKYKPDIDIRRGNILNIINRRSEKPVAAVFFRNALYHLCENNITEVVFNKAKINTDIDRKAILKDLVDRVHQHLDKNGIFVLGVHVKDHLFWADKYTSPDNTIKLKDTGFFKNSVFTKNSREEALNGLCTKISPLVEALTDRFIPIGFSKSRELYKSMSVPTIWKKVR